MRFLAVISAVAGLLACSKSHDRAGSASRSASEAITIDTVTATDTVKSIDYANRTVTLEGPNGATERYRIRPEIVIFDQIHVGDKVHATVAESLVVGVRKSAVPPNADEPVAVALALKGAKPGMVVTKTTEATAKIVDIDGANRTITLAGLTGGPRRIKLAPSVDLSNLRKDDHVVVRYTDGLALYVTKP
jgi:hypothetical protein